LADKLAHFAWMHDRVHAAVNADMVAKWERGVKGISPRYRALLCQLFGVTAEQLGFSPTPSAAPNQPVRDSESLVSLLDDAANLLDQLGAAGTALAPQMLSAWKDTTTSRRTMLGLLDPAATDPAGHARAATATITDLEQLAQRYQALHATADPAALLTPVAAHIRMATATLGQEHTAPQRRRLRRNLAVVATLAGRLAYEDLGDAPSRPLLLQPGRRQRPRSRRPPSRRHRAWLHRPACPRPRHDRRRAQPPLHRPHPCRARTHRHTLARDHPSHHPRRLR
jgi:hypothetical protein